MKKFAIVLLALVIAGSAFAAEKIDDPNAVPQLAGIVDNPMREATLSFSGFTAAGGIFTQQDPDPLTGNFSGAVGDFVLDADGLGFTWCDDLCVLIANADLSVLHVQMGGFSNFGATHRFGWDFGSSGAAGTPGGGAVDFGQEIDVTGWYLFLGNGYGPGGDGVWTGSVQMLGSVVDNDQASFDSVKALYR